jgi:hypothetical protein
VYDHRFPTLLRFSTFLYSENSATNPITVKAGVGFVQSLVLGTEATLSTNMFLKAYAGNVGLLYTFYVPAISRQYESFSWPYIRFQKRYQDGRALILLLQSRLANELEQDAYNAGWKPSN